MRSWEPHVGGGGFHSFCECSQLRTVRVKWSGSQLGDLTVRKIRMDKHCWTKSSVSKGARRMKGAKTSWTQRVKLSYRPETVTETTKISFGCKKKKKVGVTGNLIICIWGCNKLVLPFDYLKPGWRKDAFREKGKVKIKSSISPLLVRCRLSGRGENGKRSDCVLPRCSVSRTGRASCSTSSSQAGVRSASGGLEPGLCLFDSVTSGVGGGWGWDEGWTNRLMVEWYPPDLIQLLSLKCQQFAIKSNCGADSREVTDATPSCCTSLWIYSTHELSWRPLRFT